MCCNVIEFNKLGRVKRNWYLSPMRAAKVQVSLRIRAVWPEPPLLPHTSSESRGIFRQKARSQAPLNGWACAVKICHDGMLEDTNSLDRAQLVFKLIVPVHFWYLSNKEKSFSRNCPPVISDFRCRCWHRLWRWFPASSGCRHCSPDLGLFVYQSH